MKTVVTAADGRAERHAALRMAKKIPGVRRVTLGADKDYDTRDFVRHLRRMKVTRTWRGTPPTGRVRLTGARRVIRATL